MQFVTGTVEEVNMGSRACETSYPDRVSQASYSRKSRIVHFKGQGHIMAHYA